MTRIDRSTSSTRPALRGVFTALVTPFADDGSLDEAALRQLVRWQVLTGIDGLVPVGTTGESPTLTPAERDRVIALTVETVAERPSRSRVTILAGTGTNDTAATVAATRRAAELGADAALVVAPYYNRPDQRMLEAHYRAVADDGGLPIVVYNVPSRTGTNVEPATLLRLARAPPDRRREGGLRQPRPDRLDLPRAAARLRLPGRRRRLDAGRSWRWAATASSRSRPTRSPATWSRCARAARAGDLDGARRIHERWLPLFRANFAGGPNPVPVKAALALMGLISRRRPGAAPVARRAGPGEPRRPCSGRPACSTRRAAGWPDRSETAVVGQEAVA